MTNLPAPLVQPLNRRIPDWLQRLKWTCELQMEPRAFHESLEQFFVLCHFPRPAIDYDATRGSGTAFATKAEHEPGYFPEQGSSQDKRDLIVNWRNGTVDGVTEIAWICVDSSAQYRSEAAMRRSLGLPGIDDESQSRFVNEIKWYLRYAEMHRFRELLEQEKPYTARSSASGGAGYVLGPGELPDIEKIAAAGFVAKDYSSCAQAGELDDLKDGVLPLGQYVFGKSDDALSYGQRLYLAPHDNGALREYDGALIVAPINRGKTQLLKRWAIAANRAGHSVLLVDVKGHLFAQLRNQLKGRVLHFTTDPAIPCGDTSASANASDRMNLLDGLEWQSAEGRKRIDSIVEILLPAAGWRGEGGDAEMRFANRVKYLRAFINILLMAHHYSGDMRPPDLGDLYDLANSEARLIRCLRIIAAGEAAVRKNGPVPAIGFTWWANEVAPLISSKLLPQFGQRDPTKGYVDYTLGVLIALRPFARDGVFYLKIASHGPGSEFSLDLLDGREQVTLVLSLRTQDGLESDTLFSVAAKRLEQVLYERFKKDNPRPVLLLLDEAIRLREFDPPGFIAVAREAKAGCVAVYQSLDPIEEDKRRLLLSTVGTQIYLGSLPAGTARLLTDNLPKRMSNVPSISITESPQGRTRSITYSRESVPLVGMPELTQLPAWPYSAFVYIRDHRSEKPFIVDLDERPSRVVRVGKSAAARFDSVEDAIKDIVSAELAKHRSAFSEQPGSPAFWKQLAAVMPPRVQIRVESGYIGGGGMHLQEGRRPTGHFDVVGNIEIVADDPALPKPKFPGIECLAGAISLRGIEADYLGSTAEQRVEMENCILPDIHCWAHILLRDCSLEKVTGTAGRIRIEGGSIDNFFLEGNVQAIVTGVNFKGPNASIALRETEVTLQDCTGRLNFVFGRKLLRSVQHPVQPSLTMRGCEISGAAIWSWGGRIELSDCNIYDQDDDGSVITVNVDSSPREDDPSPPATIVSITRSEIDADCGPLRAGSNVEVSAVDSRLISRKFLPTIVEGRGHFRGCELYGGISPWGSEPSWTLEDCELALDSADRVGWWFDAVENKTCTSRNVSIKLADLYNHPLPGTVESIHGSPGASHYFMVTRHGDQRFLATRERCPLDGWYQSADKRFARFDELREDSTLAFSGDGSMVLEMTGSMVRRWRTTWLGQKQVDSLPLPCRGSRIVALSIDGAAFAVAAGSQVYLYGSKRWHAIEEIRLGEISMLKFTANGRMLMIGGADGLSLYDLEKLRIARRFKTPTVAVAADIRHTGAIAVLTEDRRIYLVGSGKPVVADLGRAARDRFIGPLDSPAVSLPRDSRPSVTFSENLSEQYPESATLVVCGLPGMTYVLQADTLKLGVAIASDQSAVADNASLLVIRGERVLDYCLEHNWEFDDYYY